MTKIELLERVKVGLGNVPTELNDTIELYIDEVIEYLISGGVSVELLDVENDFIHNKCVGCIIRGVSDLWNYGNSDTKLSEYFYQRADQLRSKSNG